MDIQEIQSEQQATLDENNNGVSVPSPISSDEAAPEKTPDSEGVLIVPRIVVNYIVVAAVFFGLGLGIGYLVNRANDAENQALINQAVAAALGSRPDVVGNQADPNRRYEVSVDDDPALGPEDAPVVIVEFSDFKCPYCGRFARDTFPLLQEDYGDQIRIVFRDYPILGAASVQSALAAGCANAQGRFWEFHDWMFDNQLLLSADDAAANRELFTGFASEHELDMDEFTSCLDNETFQDEILNDYRDGQRVGVTGTPTFFVNGRLISGAQPFTVFADAIEQELAAGQESGAEG